MKIKSRNLDLLSHHGDIKNTEIPTQSEIQTWLRDVYGILVCISFKPNIKKWDFITYYASLDGRNYSAYNLAVMRTHQDRIYDTYEDALEDGIYQGLLMVYESELNVGDTVVFDGKILTITGFDMWFHSCTFKEIEISPTEFSRHPAPLKVWI